MGSRRDLEAPVSRSQYGAAAGTTKGAAPRLALLHPPKVLALREDEMLAVRSLSDYAERGLYEALAEMADFETGQIFPLTYAQLMALGSPPRSEKGPTRRGPSYQQLRRMLNDLELAGLVARDKAGNAAQGELRLVLPLRAAHSAEWKKQSAQRLKQQRLQQGATARKAA